MYSHVGVLRLVDMTAPHCHRQWKVFVVADGLTNNLLQGLHLNWFRPMEVLDFDIRSDADQVNALVMLG